MSQKQIQRWIEIVKTYAVPVIVVASFVSIFKTEISQFFGYDKRQPASLSALQLASIAQGAMSVEQTEARLLEGMNSEEIANKLKANRHQWLLTRQPYSVSADVIAKTEKRSSKKLPKRFESNPIFRLFEDLQNNTASVNYEDKLACDSTRLFYEQQIQKNPKLKEMSAARFVAPGEFSHQCLTFSMNQFTVPKANYAICERSGGNPLLPGHKPCVTPTLVNLTYNAFMDVTKCLDLNPKNLMPKVDFESGFFLNTYGENKKAGIGQLSKPEIDLVNTHFEKYWKEVEKKATQNSYCSRLMASKDIINPVSSSNDERCSLIGLPHNPVRNIFYLAVLHKQNTADVTTKLEALQIKGRLEALGLNKPDMKFFVSMMTTAADTMGFERAVQILDSYLTQRQQAGLNLRPADFDFYSNPQQTDLDGEARSETDIARANVMSSYMSPTDTKAEVALKVARRRILPLEWASAYTKRFPVYLTYKANSYDGHSVLQPFSVFGYPGYLTLIAERQQSIRAIFSNSELNPDQCTEKDYLKYVQSN